jgi:hypothetical protein
MEPPKPFDFVRSGTKCGAACCSDASPQSLDEDSDNTTQGTGNVVSVVGMTSAGAGGSGSAVAGEGYDSNRYTLHTHTHIHTHTHSLSLSLTHTHTRLSARPLGIIGLAGHVDVQRNDKIKTDQPVYELFKVTAGSCIKSYYADATKVRADQSHCIRHLTPHTHTNLEPRTSNLQPPTSNL